MIGWFRTTVDIVLVDTPANGLRLIRPIIAVARCYPISADGRCPMSLSWHHVVRTMQMDQLEHLARNASL